MRSLSLCEFLDKELKMQGGKLIPARSQLMRSIFSTQMQDVWKSLKARTGNQGHHGGASSQVVVTLEQH